MRGGFTFNGVDIADIGLEYAPELGDTFVYRPTAAKIHEESFDGHDGGYFYGLTKDPKEFTLRCYFEQKEISYGVMEKIHFMFRRGNSGKLVFKQRPWCYYYATVVDVDDRELFNHLNGFIKITMKAYYPFARSDHWVYDQKYLDYFKVMGSTALLDKELWMPPTFVDTENDVTSATSLLLYNAGNEYASVGIELAGDGAEGVIIENKTTGQTCCFQAFTKANTTDVNKYIYYDSINGKPLVVETESDQETITSKTLNALYHAYGRLDLAPGYPILRDMYLSAYGNNTAVFVNMLYDEGPEPEEERKANANLRFKGRFVFCHGDWRQIKEVVDKHTLLLEQNVVEDNVIKEQKVWHVCQNETQGVQKTVITGMNIIEVRPVISMALTRCKFNYKHTFA